MPFPKTDTELNAAGYRFLSRGRCQGADCGEEIEFWQTPAGKQIPLTAGTLEPHFADCPNARDFRKNPPSGGKGAI